MVVGVGFGVDEADGGEVVGLLGGGGRHRRRFTNLFLSRKSFLSEHILIIDLMFFSQNHTTPIVEKKNIIFDVKSALKKGFSTTTL